MANYKALDIANWFLTKNEMSPKKLQKMVYYAYSWFLTLYNETEKELNNRLFDEKIEAWVHGPVIPELYSKYKKFGYREIPQYDGEPIKLDEQTNDVLEQVYSIYGDYDANELESISHQEKPWKVAREGYEPLDNCDEAIDDKVIFKYYGKRVAN